MRVRLLRVKKGVVTANLALDEDRRPADRPTHSFKKLFPHQHPQSSQNAMQRSLPFVALLAVLGSAHVAGAQGQVTAQVVNIGRWSGTLRGQTMSSATDQTRFSGTVEVMPLLNERTGEFRVRIRLSASAATGDMEWSISPGRCGYKLQFLLSPSNVPPLEIRSGGSAEVEYEGIINLNTQATYHIPVFQGGHLQQNMVACANLKFEPPR